MQSLCHFRRVKSAVVWMRIFSAVLSSLTFYGKSSKDRINQLIIQKRFVSTGMELASVVKLLQGMFFIKAVIRVHITAFIKKILYFQTQNIIINIKGKIKSF